MNATTQRTLNIPLAPWPNYDQEQIDAITEVYKSGRVNYLRGKIGPEFEREFATWSGTKKALVVGNGTLAIEIILRGLGLEPGDEVITTPRTFVATSSACVVNGLVPVLADIDLESGNITPETVAPLITKKTKAIMPVHLGGWPADMEGFLQLAEQHNLYVIEDCAQAHGAKIGGRSVGSFGHANAWSFCLDKIITTGGEGGMVTTDDEELWNRMWSLKDHGKDYDATYIRKHPPGFQWLHESWGTNWRITEPQSAIGRIQLARMSEWHAIRTANAELLRDRFQSLSAVHVPWPKDGFTNAWYRFYLHIHQDALKDGWNRDRIQAECKNRGLDLSVGSCSEIYLEKCFVDSGYGPKEPLPNARFMTGLALAFLVHPGMTAEMQHAIADVFEDVVKEATR